MLDLRSGAACLVLSLFLLSGCNLYYDVDSVERPGGGLDASHEEDTGCETDEELCSEATQECGSESFVDSCGQERRLVCFDCEPGQSCQEGMCVCRNPSGQELCDAHGADACGTLVVVDDCGQSRTVQCGTCGPGEACGEDNHCRACRVDCQGLCGMVSDGCGEFVDCSSDDAQEQGGERCPGSESCVNTMCAAGGCDPLESCETTQCGKRADGCGGVVTCDLQCADDEACLANACVCVPESDAQLCDAAGATCGEITVEDRCGVSRDLECGSCGTGLVCTENECGPDPAICAGLDLDTNFLHCGSCGSSCELNEVCVGGSCQTVTCPDQGIAQGSCEPVTPSGCNFETHRCDLILADMTTLQLTCQGRLPDETQARGPGASCSRSGECEEGLLCTQIETDDPRGLACMRPCFRQAETTCGEREACVGIFDDEEASALGSVGFCSPTCNPFVSTSCDAGQRCVADPAFPDRSCSPRFRCKRSGGSTGKTVGSSCDRNSLLTDGCPPELSCFPAGPEGSDVCVRPCVTGNCPAAAACLNAEEPWQAFRYCAF